MRKIEKDVRFWGMCDDRLKCAACQHGIHMWILGAFLHLNILEQFGESWPSCLCPLSFEWSKLRRPKSFAVGLATWYQFSLKSPPPVKYSTMTRYVTDVTHCSDFWLGFSVLSRCWLLHPDCKKSIAWWVDGGSRCKMCGLVIHMLSIKNIASWKFWCSMHILSLCKSVRNFVWCPRGWVNASFEPQPPKNAGKAGWHGNVWIYFWVKWKASWPPGPLQFLAFSTSVWPAAGWALREWVNGQVMSPMVV